MTSPEGALEQASPGVGAGEALARAALAGNPSDGYEGAVLALTLPGRRARATAVPAARPDVTPDSELVRATIRCFAREHAPAAAASAVRWSTSIPRGVGLGGSSAIVIAVLRALASLHHVGLAEPELAELALSIEVDELGIAAGLQDRVAQAYGGLTFMDFDPAAGPHRYERLDPALLPPLLVAWRADAGGHSGDVHAPLSDRYARGEPDVMQALDELGALARRARAALLEGDRPELVRCVNGSFDARRRMLSLDPRHVEMIECARACGAGANYAGSGGAIVAVCEHGEHRRRLAAALRRSSCQMLSP
jgi:glucuronokinase